MRARRTTPPFSMVVNFLCQSAFLAAPGLAGSTKANGGRWVAPTDGVRSLSLDGNPPRVVCPVQENSYAILREVLVDGLPASLPVPVVVED